jgi:hypothetical protein
MAAESLAHGREQLALEIGGTARSGSRAVSIFAREHLPSRDRGCKLAGCEGAGYPFESPDVLKKESYVQAN